MRINGLARLLFELSIEKCIINYSVEKGAFILYTYTFIHISKNAFTLISQFIHFSYCLKYYDFYFELKWVRSLNFYVYILEV